MTTSSSKLPIVLEESGNLLIVQFNQPIVNASWTEIEAAGDAAIEKLKSADTTGCLIDLSQLTHMGSINIALIVRLWKASRAAKRDCVVICPEEGGVVRQTIMLAGLESLLPMVDSREDAQVYLANKKDKAVRGRLGKVLLLGGILGVVLAGVGFVLAFLDFSTLIVAQSLLYTGAAIGFICGMMYLMIFPGHRRAWGAIIAVASIAFALAGIWEAETQGPISSETASDQVLDGG